MSKVRIFTPENRLAKVLKGPDVRPRAELLAAAETELERLEPAIRAELQRHVKKIAEIATAGERATREGSAELTAAALGITDLAAGAKLAAVGEVARGIAALTDGLDRDGVWRQEVFLLHVDALNLVYARGGEVHVYEKMIADLKRVRATLGST